MTKDTDKENRKELKRSEDDKNQSAMQRRIARRKNRGNNDSADWSEVNGDVIRDLIAVVTGLKGTVTFGYTRDGGAYYINYYVEGESDKIYIRPTEDIDQTLHIEATSWI